MEYAVDELVKVLIGEERIQAAIEHLDALKKQADQKKEDHERAEAELRRLKREADWAQAQYQEGLGYLDKLGIISRDDWLFSYENPSRIEPFSFSREGPTQIQIHGIPVGGSREEIGLALRRLISESERAGEEVIPPPSGP